MLLLRNKNDFIALQIYSIYIEKYRIHIEIDVL